MGLLSSSKPSGSTSSVGTATLNGAHISLTMLEKVMDGVNVPFIKGVAGVAVEVIKIAKAIQTNREECDDLMKRTTSLLVVILSSLSGKTQDAIPDHLKNGVERLTASFQDVLGELRIIDKRAGIRSIGGLARSILYYTDNGEKLRSCSAKLEWAMGEFQVTAKVDSCLKDLERHEELRKGQEQLRDGLIEIRDVIKDKMTTTNSLSDNLPSTVMPADPKIFGREEYVEKAVILLVFSGAARLVILGPGGMGKTSVSLKIVHNPRVKERYGQYRCWVPCEQATSIPLFIELLAKSLNLPPSSSSDRFGEIVIFLENAQHLYLLLLDNFETPWDIEGQQSDVADILTRLASIPTVSLLITMRSGQYPSSNTIEWTTPRLPSLTQLDLDSAEEAFLKISPDAAGDPELKKLLQALDCMPLAITLMAKLSEAGETVPDLLSQWSTERTRLLDQPGGDRRNSIEVSIKLSLQSRAVKGNPDAIRLLSVLSMLPAGAALDRLPDMCPSIPSWKGALRVLRGAALVYDSADKSRVQVLSPIQSYIMLHHPLEQHLLEELRLAFYRLAPPDKTTLEHPDFNHVSRELWKEEVNMEAILINALQDANSDREGAVRASLSYTAYLYYKQPRTEVIADAIRVAREIGSSLLAQCLHEQGNILRAQGKDDLAEPVYDDAKEEFIKIGDETSAAMVQSLLGAILSARGHFESARVTLQEARDSLLKQNSAAAAAWCLWDIGQSFYSECEWSSACSAYEQARDEFVSINHRAGTTYCLMSLGATYGCQEDLDAAQTALEEARLAYLEMGDPGNVACCLSYLGDAHSIAGNYSVALGKYGEALDIFNEVGNVKWIETCKTSIEDVSTKLANQ
ncbi:hypothetical protein FRC02_009212 [Tulasnella sp. 418]|nr:hypothetical protein FRC02_009212 [Tulasnella sp. 418]